MSRLSFRARQAREGSARPDGAVSPPSNTITDIITMAAPPAPSPNTRPHPFFDISIGGAPAGRIVFELYSDVVPKTVSTRACLLDAGC
jgi:hypothetical protein